MKVHFEIIMGDGAVHLCNYFEMPSVPRNGDVVELPGHPSFCVEQCIWRSVSGGWVPVLFCGGGDYSPSFEARLVEAGWSNEYPGPLTANEVRAHQLADQFEDDQGRPWRVSSKRGSGDNWVIDLESLEDDRTDVVTLTLDDERWKTLRPIR